MKEHRKPGRREGSKLLGRELRLRRGKRSLAEMARLSESPPLAGRVEPLSGSYIHKLEKGLRLPSVKSLRTLNLLYGLSVEHMLRLIEAENLARLEPEGAGIEELLQESRDEISMGDYRAAFAAALRAEELAETVDDRFVACHNKAISLWKLGMPWEAAAELEEILSTPDIPRRYEASVYYNLAGIFRSLWNLRLAQGFARMGLEVATTVESRQERAQLLRLLGNILSDRAEEDPESTERLCREAVRHYEKAIVIYEELGLDDQVAVAIANLGVIYRIEGNRILAFERLREALGKCRASRNQRGVAFTLKELGRAYLEAGEWEHAREYLLQAETAASRAGYTDIQFQALVHIAEGAAAAGEPAEPTVRRARGLLPFLEERFPERDRFEQNLGEREQEAGGGSA